MAEKLLAGKYAVLPEDAVVPAKETPNPFGAAPSCNLAITNSYFLATTKDPKSLHIVSLDRVGASDLRKYCSESSVFAAINGNYFDYRKDELVPTGLVIENGRKLSSASYERNDEKSKKETKWYGIFYVKNDGSAGMLKSSEFRKNYGTDFSGITTAIECGPVLVSNGEVATGNTKDSRPRSAIIVMDGGQVGIIMTKKSMTLKQFAEQLAKIGAADALNLDGGSSSKFYSEGINKSFTGRGVANFIKITTD